MLEVRIDWRNEAGSIQPYRGWAPGCDLAAFDDPSNQTKPRVLKVLSVRSFHILICRVKGQGTSFRVNEQTALSSFTDMKIRCHEIFRYGYAIWRHPGSFFIGASLGKKNIPGVLDGIR